MLRNRPVYPLTNPYSSLPFQVLTVNVDEGGYYGSASGAFTGNDLVYGTDYCLQIDQDDGSSRSAILLRIGNYWPRPQVRQVGLLTPFMADDMGSVQVKYTAGYTVDTLPAVLRLALDQFVAQVRLMFPLGAILASESYEDRSVSYLNERRDALLAMVKPMIWTFRNWKW